MMDDDEEEEPLFNSDEEQEIKEQDSKYSSAASNVEKKSYLHVNSIPTAILNRQFNWPSCEEQNWRHLSGKSLIVSVVVIADIYKSSATPTNPAFLLLLPLLLSLIYVCDTIFQISSFETRMARLLMPA